MTFQEIDAMVSSIGLEYAYYQWPINEAPALPYILFYYPERKDFMADGINYQHITALNIELYTKNKDFSNEALVESVLETYGIRYSKEEQYIPEEKMYEVLYTMEVCINGSES